MSLMNLFLINKNQISKWLDPNSDRPLFLFYLNRYLKFIDYDIICGGNKECMKEEMNMKETKNMKEKLHHLLIILIPILITQMGMYSMNFFDTTMSGHYSAKDLAGVA